MTSGKINDRVVVQRVIWIKQMREAIKDLPIQEKKEFLQNPHHEISAEELFDICAHHLDEIQLLCNRLVSRLRKPKKG